jgi:hypothetical protein
MTTDTLGGIMIMEIIIMDGRTWMALIFPSSKRYHYAKLFVLHARALI